MSKDIMLVSSVPTFMMNDLQQEYVLHDHAHILDPEHLPKLPLLWAWVVRPKLIVSCWRCFPTSK